MPTSDLLDPPEPTPEPTAGAEAEVLIIVGSDDAPVCTDGVCAL